MNTKYSEEQGDGSFMKNLILASGSPRRRELMSQVGLDFTVVTSDADENIKEMEPEDYVRELSSVKAQSVKAQKVALNDIPLPWYSQKISGCPYAHCSLASSLMVYDYFKGMTSDSCRSASEAEAKLVEYQKNYFLKKRAPFKRRTSVGQGGYYSFEIDSLTRYYEHMVSAEHFMNKDYRILKSYIDRGIPVLINVRHRGSTRGLLQPGSHRHWMVLRGINDTHVWINDPGRSATMRNKGENQCFPIKKERGNPAWFDGCWTGRYIVITPRIPLAMARIGKLPPVEETIAIKPPFIPWKELPEVIDL